MNGSNLHFSSVLHSCNNFYKYLAGNFPRITSHAPKSLLLTHARILTAFVFKIEIYVKKVVNFDLTNPSWEISQMPGSTANIAYVSCKNGTLSSLLRKYFSKFYQV